MVAALSCQRHCGVLDLAMDLTIVVLNWNVVDMLEGCLVSLPGACGNLWPRTQVIVVDNASTDNSVDMVRSRHPYVQLIALPENVGFTKGNNAGIRVATGSYVLLLNPDTYAHPGSIAALYRYMEEHPEVGIAGPRLLNADGTLQHSRRRFPTLATGILESTPLQRFFSGASAVKHFYMEDVPDEGAQEVDWLSGAALLCRRATLEQIGPFDPGYFMFSEEVDLCRRAKDAGWQVAYVPEARVTHYGGGSTDQAIAARHIHFNSSKARYFRVHEGRLIGELVRLFIMSSYAVQMVSEASKWLLRHKRHMRSTRIKMYARVLGSGLRRKVGDEVSKRHRVSLITGEFPPARGGVGDYTCKLTLALNEQGAEAGVLTQRVGNDEKGAASSLGRTRMRVHRTRRLTVGSIVRVLRASRADVAHIQYQTGAYAMRPTINLLPLLLRVLWRKPTVVTFHDLLVPYLFPKAGPVREWANRLLTRGASAVIATNAADAERLKGWGVQEPHLIPIGSNIKNNPPADYSREAWRAEHGVEADKVLLAYFGFLNSTKGLDSLLESIAILEGREPGCYRLMMVGGGLGSSDPTNRATAAALDDLAGKLGIAGALIWTGYLETEGVSAALLSADMAVLPYADGASFRRGSLLAVLEHGLPLITTRPGTGRHETAQPRLEHSENAMLIPPGNVDALVEAIEQLSSDDSLKRRLGRGAVALAQHFTWETIATSHLLLYNRLIN